MAEFFGKALPPARLNAEYNQRKDRGNDNVATVTATYRLPSMIIPVLLKASSDRKIKSIQPFTQQGIVAEALTAWLQKNGYQV